MCIDAQGKFSKTKELAEIPSPRVFPVSVALATGPSPLARSF